MMEGLADMMGEPEEVEEPMERIKGAAVTTITVPSIISLRPEEG